jgi:DNA repair exonuclease SbcCD nuclease subunit
MLSEAQKPHGQVVCVVGNHDRTSESAGAANTYSTVRVFSDILDNVVVLDVPVTFKLACGALLHALPSGYAYDQVKMVYKPDPAKLNIFAFHGLVKGALFDGAGAVEIHEGLTLADLDDARWDIVLGGDVHVPQRFQLQKTRGGYVGATLRLTEADADDKRGFLDVVLEKGKEPVTTFIEGGGPTFAKLALTADQSAWPSSEPYAGAILIVTLSGTAKDLRAIPNAVVKEYFACAREVVVHRKPEQIVPTLVKGISASSVPFDDAVAFIRASDRGGLDEHRLIAKAALAMGATPERKGIFR